MSPLIRRARADDLERLTEWERACFSDAWRRDWLAAVLHEPRYLVFIIEDGGYILGWSAAGEAEIERLGVLPNQRGKGWGRALVQAIVEQFGARGVEGVFLEVRQNNAAARAIYGACGFEQSGRRRAYYDDGEDAILMRSAPQGHKEQGAGNKAGE